jgi:chromate transporter
VTIAKIREDLVERRGVLGDEEYALSFALARVAPGTNVLAFCAAIGWRLRGWPGAAISVAALSMPAAVAVVLLTLAYEAWRAAPLGHAVISGAMSAVVGVIFGGAWLLIAPYLRRERRVRAAVFAAGAFLLAPLISPVWILLLAAAAGYIWRDA